MAKVETKLDIDREFASATRSMLTGLWKLPLRHCLQSRSFHAFCIGTSKSGTHSIANMFPKRYRVEHEPATRLLNKVIIDYRQGKLIDQSVRRFFQLRDIKLWLELESNYFNFYFVEHLVELFPKAKFILTLRAPAAWLDSWINHTIDRREVKGSIWAKGLNAIFSPRQFEYGREETVFRRYDLLPLACYLHYWRSHNLKVLNAVPTQRLLVIRTDEISQSAERMAQFLGIPNQGFDVRESHSFKTRSKHHVLEKLDQDYLSDMLYEYNDNRLIRHLPAAEPQLATAPGRIDWLDSRATGSDVSGYRGLHAHD